MTFAFCFFKESKTQLEGEEHLSHCTEALITVLSIFFHLILSQSAIYSHHSPLTKWGCKVENKVDLLKLTVVSDGVYTYILVTGTTTQVTYCLHRAEH